MARRTSRKSAQDLIADAIISPGRPLPPALARRGIHELNGREVARLSRDVALRERTARLSARALQPLVGMIEQDPGARRAMEGRNRLIVPRAAPKVTFPRVEQVVEREVRSGSIMSVVGKPFDYEWDEHSPANQTTWGSTYVTASGYDPRFNTSTHIGFGGGAWAAAGIGQSFTPVGRNTTWVRIGVYAPCLFDWQANSTLATAHTRGFIGVFVQSYGLNGQDWRVEVDRRIWLWSAGSSWWDELSNAGSTHYPSDTYFLASSARRYIVWVWSHTSADATSGGIYRSYARGSISVSLGFLVFEQWT